MFLPVASRGAHPHFGKNKPTTLLFNVVSDIGCANNVADQHRDVVERLNRMAETARRDLGDRGKRGSGQRAAGKVTTPPKALLKRGD